MSYSESPSDPLGPLNPGDVVSAALRLYRDRAKVYLQLSALATLWIFAGISGMATVILLLAAGLGVLGGGAGLTLLGALLGALVGLVILFYGIAKYILISSAIGRLAFSDLVNRPETSLAVRQALSPKLGQFLSLGFLLTLAFMAAYIVSVMVAGLVGFGSGLVVGGLLGALTNTAVGSIAGVMLGTILGVAVFALGLIWIVSHLFIPEVVLAVEANQDAGSSLSRSWELTQKSIGRIQIVFLATFLIQLPVMSITNYLPSLIFAFLPSTTTMFVISQGLGLLLSLAGSIVLLPLWQAVKGVLYYDLRSRREGLDLEMR